MTVMEVFVEGKWIAAIHVIHDFTVAMWVGTALWMTFFSGIMLFRHLNRDTFATVQGILFPKYFQICTFSGVVTVVTFFMEHLAKKTIPMPENWSAMRIVKSSIQLLHSDAKLPATLAWLALLCSFLNMILVGPGTRSSLDNLHKKKMNAREQHGDEDPAFIDNDPEVRAAKKSFGIWHGMSSLCNLFMIIGIVGHLVLSSLAET